MKRFCIITFIFITIFSGCKKASNAIDSENPFFFRQSTINYHGDFLPDNTENHVKKDVVLSISKVEQFSSGTVYEFQIDTNGVQHEGLNEYYFYVQKDKIYKISKTNENLVKLKKGESLGDDTFSTVICSDEEIKDSLGEDEMGWHQYVSVNGNKRKYSYYNNTGATTFGEFFVWEENRGLIEYSCIYGGAREYMELHKK